MLHTGTKDIALTGCVAHRNKQGKTIYFSRREPSVVSHSGDVSSLETPRHRKFVNHNSDDS